jgi:hypothetical protein
VTFTCAAGAASDQTLASRIASHDGWSGYTVPMIADAGTPCCYSWNGKHRGIKGCTLDARNWSFGTNDDDPPAPSDDSLAVYLHVAGGKIDKVRALGASCPVTDRDQVRVLDGVAPGESVALLTNWIEIQSDSNERGELGVAALAYHAEPAATKAMAQFAAPGHARKLREQSLFWLGQARGVPGVDVVERFATTDPDPKLREHAVFALSQARGGEGYPRILAIAKTDASDHVRSQALFWMAQSGDARARADITARLREERSAEVREQAVFALSQLKSDQADAALIALLQGDFPRPVKERALFWLGQSGSDKALEYLDRVLAISAPKREGR